MNECNDPDHGAINAERSESRGLRKAWIELDDKRQQLERELTAAREETDKWEQIAHDKLSEVCRQIEKTRIVTEQRDAVTLRLGKTQERMIDAERQRDRMAEAIRKHRDELKLTSGESVDRILWNTLAAVKENQKTDSQSCPECDALASYGSNDGPCETHKL
jgi:glutamyl-tRNA reductase